MITITMRVKGRHYSALELQAILGMVFDGLDDLGYQCDVLGGSLATGLFDCDMIRKVDQ